LYCFDRTTGAKKWVQTVTYGKEEPTHKTNPHGSTTPVANGKQVVVWHGSAGLYCYDFTGKELWKQELGEFVHMWGAGTSPVLVGDRVIIHSGPGKKVLVAAFEVATGKPLWSNEEPIEGNGEYRPDKGYLGSWSTPLVAKINNQDEVICAFPTRVVSYAPADGKTLWICDGLRGPKGDLSYSSPVISGDICVQIGGFQGPGLGFKLGGSGNITEKQRLWREEKNPQSIGSGVVVEGYFYRPNAGPGTIDCLDPQTGKILWTERSATFWGSMVSVAGRCYVTGQDGVTIVFKPSPEKFELLAKNSLGEASNATPAISDGQWFLRTHRHLYCIAE
jgi:outer membrane protein assembly factor BamB